MYRLQPIALIVEGDSTYLVRFNSDQGEVEYRFTANDNGFLSIGCESAFAMITNDDPAVPLLTQAIANFHQARTYQYASDRE